MMKYLVEKNYEYTDTYYVEADSAEEAEELAGAMDSSGRINEVLIETLVGELNN